MMGAVTGSHQGCGEIFRDSNGDTKMTYFSNKAGKSILEQEMREILQGVKLCSVLGLY